jgi:aldehyde dehydrogenase (NAD+)
MGNGNLLGDLIILKNCYYSGFTLNMSVPETKLSEITAKVEKLRESFNAGKSLSYTWRESQLKAIKKMCTENEPLIASALNKDLGRGEFEAIGLELLPLYMEIDHALSSLSSWMQPELKATPMGMAPSCSEVHRVPYGVSLIISPFNYPLNLCLGPLVGSIAAGNCTLVKPSEMTPNVEQIIYDLLPKYLDMSCTEMVFGGITTSQNVMTLKYDKIFFTGSTRVGKLIMKSKCPLSLVLFGLCSYTSY